MPSTAGMFSSIGPDLGLHRLRAERDRALEGMGGIDHAKRHGAGARPVQLGEAARETVRLCVDHEVDVALAIQRHVLRAVLGDRREPHGLEQPAELLRLGRGVLDELEAVGAHRVVVADGRRRCVVRIRAHGKPRMLVRLRAV